MTKKEFMFGRKFILCAAILFVLLFCSATLMAQSSARVNVSFDYNKTSTTGGNQFAVWVADKNGQFVKTLYVTSFSGKGGYMNRPLSLPLWAKSHSKSGLNAVTRATPRSSTASKITCSWDFTDSSGNALPRNTEYILYVEATILNESSVLYTGTINPKASGTIKLTPEYSTDEAKKSNMIANVRATLQ